MEKVESIPHTLLETSSYVKAVSQFWSEDEQREFKTFLGLNYQLGDIIPGTGGVRKIRWAASGHGQRGGARVIYYYYDEDEPIYLIFAYPKNVKANLTETEKKAMRSLAAQIKKSVRGKRESK